MRRALAILALVLVLLAAGAAWLLLTGGGLRWLVGLGLAQAPEGYRVAAAHGRAIGPIVLEGVAARWDGGEARIARVQLDWQPGRSLREGRLVVGVLLVNGVRVKLVSAQGPAGEAPAVKLPPVLIERARVDDLEIAQADAAPQQVQSIEVALETTREGVRVQRLAVSAQPAQLEVSGTVALSPELAFDLATQWEFAPGEGLAVRGSGRVHGPLSALQLQQALTGAVQGDVQATLALGEALRWEARGVIEHLDAAAFAAAVPATVTAGEWSARGGPAHARIEARATVTGLTPQPGRFDAVLEAREAHWRIERLRLTDTAGTVYADARGTYDGTALSLEFESADLAFDGIAWARLQGKVDWRDGEASPVEARVAAQGLRVGGLTDLEARLEARGTRAQASGQLQAQTASGQRLEQAFAVSTQDGATQVTVRDGRLALPEAGEWRQEAPVTVRATSGGGEVPRACWRSERGRVCADGRWQGKTADAAFELADLDLTLAQPWLDSRGWKIAGTAGGRGTLNVRDGALASGTLELTTSGGDLHRPSDGVTPDFRAPMQARATATLEAGAVNGNANLDLGEYGSAQASVQVAAPAQPGQAWSARPLGGTVRALVPDLALFTGWMPAPAHPAGRLEADLKVAGTLAEPRLGGSARVRDASMYTPRTGARLTNVQMDLEAKEGQGLGFRATADAGDGRMEIDGTVQVVSARDWELRLRVNGESARLAEVPWLALVASPAVEVTIRPGTVNYAGKVRVEQAAVVLGDFGTGITQSDDVVVLGRGEAPEAAWAVSGELSVELGKDVRISGYGFDGFLDGGLVLRQEPRVTATGRGVLSVREGSYEAYGARLKIETGRLLFPGVSLDDVQLDVVAVRPDLSTRVGVNVSGPLRTPTLSLFSDTAMEDTEILALLVTGASSRNASAAEAGALLTAAREMGLGGTERMAGEFASRLGIQEFSLGTSAASGGDLELRLGRHIGPKLLLSYVVDLGEALNSIELRYFLRPQWTVSTRTSEAGGEVEFAFTVER